MDELKNFRGVYRSKRDAKIMKNGKAGDYFYRYYKVSPQRKFPVYQIMIYNPSLNCWEWKGTFDPYASWRQSK